MFLEIYAEVTENKKDTETKGYGGVYDKAVLAVRGIQADLRL